MPAGRPELYTKELGERVCLAVASSEFGLRKTLEQDAELPSMSTVLKWTEIDAQFSQAYASAKRKQIEAMAEDIVDLANDDTLEPNDKRIRIDTRKWLLSKLIPKTYGDKLDVTSGGEALAAPAHLIDQRVQSIIMQARMRRDGQLAIEGLGEEAMNLLS